MAKTPLPDAATLHQVLRYEPETGKLFWRYRPNGPREWNSRWAGKEALTTAKKKGYLHGTLFGRRVRTHRVIVCMVTGVWPIEVDHENGVTSDNRWDNLRVVTSYEQARNKKLYASNSSGHVGLRQQPTGRWCAYISNRYLGTFATLDEALAVRRQAQEEEGFHPNHGRIVQ